MKTQVEQTVVSVHLIIAFGVFLPDTLCFCGMESGRVFLEEALHICNLQNAVIKILKWLIPCTGSTFLHRPRNGIHINDMVSDFGHQLCQNHFVDARETLCTNQIVNCQFFKPLMQTYFIFHISCHIIKLPNIFAMKPFRNEIVAIRLVRHRNKSVQAGKIFLSHSTSNSGQQQMNCQPSKIRFFLSKATSLVNHCPERTVCMILYEILINCIVIQIKSCTEHTA
ncbi:hypothetical protein IMSAGC009_03887 [Lachnospiraceae bacterium]|nr:hypothetical protein IMSAGC009_03887 [Lachnospiraceae bacterium]